VETTAYLIAMSHRIVHVVAVAGVAIVILGSLTLTSATCQEKTASPMWEYKAVSFGSDEKASTMKLNDLSASSTRSRIWSGSHPSAQRSGSTPVPSGRSGTGKENG
jgi:hypothetical protein